MTRRALFATFAAAIAGRKLLAGPAPIDPPVESAALLLMWHTAFAPAPPSPEKILVSVGDGLMAIDPHGRRLRPGDRYTILRLVKLADFGDPVSGGHVFAQDA